MTKDKIEIFFLRIDKLTLQHKALFGKMNVHQMICHCADQFRLAFGEKKAREYGRVDPNEIIALARSGKTAPTPKGFDQVEGEGTKPLDFNEDKETLKKYIIKFSELPADYKFSTHPYFGDVDRKWWESLVNYHLDHHLKQFGV
jgi:hypothetical protein